MRARTSVPTGERGDVKARLRRAALEVFARDGFAAAPVRDICAAAGANVAAINYHFGSKQNLYHEVIREQFLAFGVPLLRIPDTVRDARSWKAAVRQWMRASLTIMLDPHPPHAWVTRLFAHERHQPSPQSALLIRSFYRPVDDSLRRLIRMGLPTPVNALELQIRATAIHGQLTFLSGCAGPWRDLFLPARVHRSRWLDMTVEHLSDQITATLTYQGTESHPV